jgi:hypothetical protein
MAFVEHVMQLNNLLTDLVTCVTPYDDGVQCFLDGHRIDRGELTYKRGSISLTEFAQGWLEAYEYARM